MNDQQALIALELAAQGFASREICAVLGVRLADIEALIAEQEEPLVPQTASPLRALYFEDPNEHRGWGHPGSIWIGPCDEGGHTALRFFCPCGCEALGRITVGHAHKPNMHGPSWYWNGSRTEPTLTPSVRQSSCGWHGWLRNGYWEPC